jgi:V-type H+-transporting ATPase subunit C
VAEFIDKARDKLKITVKEFKFESGLNDVRKKKREGLEAKLKAHKKTLSEICLTYFSEIYELYVHVKMFRLVIESMMRFGSDKTVIYWIEPVAGKEKTVQTLLVQIFGDKESEGLYGTKDEIEDGEDFFPFIYVPGITF